MERFGLSRSPDIFWSGRPNVADGSKPRAAPEAIIGKHVGTMKPVLEVPDESWKIRGIPAAPS
jgi:hypothetical protein